MPEENSEMGQAGVLTEEQQALLQEAKDHFKDQLTPTYTDVMLVKFLKARNFQRDQAFTMIEEDIKWRKEFDVDNIISNFPKRKNAKKCLEYWPNLSVGHTKEGYPVFYERIGLVDPKGWCENIPKEDSIAFHIYIMELARKRMKEAVETQGTPADWGGVFVEDLEGLGWSHMYKDGISVIKEIISIDNNHYPEHMKKMIIMHPPKIFAMFWKMFKPFVDKATLEKVVIVDNNNDPLNVLLKEISIEDIPPCFGGSAKDDVEGGGSFNKSNDDEKATISPGQKFEKEISIANTESKIEWQFKIEGHTVGFACYLLSGNGTRTEVIRYCKYDNSKTIEGHLSPETTGKYVLSWDNSFSKLRKKTVYYKVNVLSVVQ